MQKPMTPYETYLTGQNMIFDAVFSSLARPARKPDQPRDFEPEDEDPDALTSEQAYRENVEAPEAHARRERLR